MEDHVETGHLTTFDAFRTNRDRVVNKVPGSEMCKPCRLAHIALR